MNKLTLATSRRRLAMVWFGGAAVVFVLFLGMSLAGPFRNERQDAWGWLLPGIVPTLSLVIGILIAQDKDPGSAGRTVNPFLFRLSVGLSVFYLGVLLVTLLVIPMVTAQDQALDYLKTSNLWLAPVQGLAAAGLGAFFTGGEPRARSSEREKGS
jgi:hypothetical protein